MPFSEHRMSTDKKGESTKSPLPLFLTTKSFCSSKSKTGNVNGMAPSYPSSSSVSSVSVWVEHNSEVDGDHDVKNAQNEK